MYANAAGSREPFRDILKFGLSFIGCTMMFFFFLDHYSSVITLIYVEPLSRAASFLLKSLGVQSDVQTDVGTGACILQLRMTAYRVTQGCTGLFTSTLYMACILSYPVSISKKLAGLVLGVPAFFVFGVLRVVMMGMVAVISPLQIEVFHVYIMAIANLGFAMFVWICWHNNVVENEKRASIFG